jgi:hypothetical protein
MIKALPFLLLTLGLLYLSCDNWEDEPEYLPSLNHTKWKVEGITPQNEGDKLLTKTTYQLEFINDSTFTLNLDINRVIGKYEVTPYGDLRIYEVKKTKDCCDSQYALLLEEIILNTDRFRLSEGGITLSGFGEIYLKNHP